MRRHPIAATLILLSPLLVAQQIPVSTSGTQVSRTPPQGIQVTLVSLDTLSTATLKAGATVHFLVWRDANVEGDIVLHAGTPIEATVTKVQPASRQHHRDGRFELRLSDVETDGLRVHLTFDDDYAPGKIQHRKSKARVIAENAGLITSFVALSPFFIPMALAITDSTKPAGDDLTLKPCFHANVYVKSIKPSPTGGGQTPGAYPGPSASHCANSKETIEFDGAFLEAANRGDMKID